MRLAGVAVRATKMSGTVSSRVSETIDDCGVGTMMNETLDALVHSSECGNHQRRDPVRVLAFDRGGIVRKNGVDGLNVVTLDRVDECASDVVRSFDFALQCDRDVGIHWLKDVIYAPVIIEMVPSRMLGAEHEPFDTRSTRAFHRYLKFFRITRVEHPFLYWTPNRGSTITQNRRCKDRDGRWGCGVA